MNSKSSALNLSSDAEAFLRCSEVISSDKDQESFFRVALAIVKQPALKSREASCLLLVSAKIVGEALLALKRMPTSEYLKTFEEAHGISDRISSWCRAITQAWGQIEGDDWNGKSLQGIYEGLKTKPKASDPSLPIWFFSTAQPEPCKEKACEAPKKTRSEREDQHAEEQIENMREKARMGWLPRA